MTVAELGAEDGWSVKDVEGAEDRTNDGITVAVLSRRLALAFLAATEDMQQIHIATRNAEAILLHVLLRIMLIYYSFSKRVTFVRRSKVDLVVCEVSAGGAGEKQDQRSERVM